MVVLAAKPRYLERVKFANASPRAGILGGGQLARMLALAGHPLGLNLNVLTSSASDPAAQVVGSTRLGSLEDESDLKKFLLDLNLVTFESEFVDTAKLRRCLPSGAFVFPNLDCLGAIQDRLTQKELLDRFKIPTAPWLPVESEADLRQAEQRFHDGFVLKQRRFGYDGYGTFVYRGRGPESSILRQTAHGFIAERFMRFKRELAISFARSRSGAFVALPLVESLQKDSRCFSVHGPVRHPGETALRKAFRALMEDMDYVGILAVELFDVAGRLHVNELAPRVHNSAHYSQDALNCDQFEYHWRAGLDWPLPAPKPLVRGFAMVNLLGGARETRLSRKPVGHLHWYGKSENRPGRKMGHINVLGASPKAALATALKWRKDFQL